MANSLRRIETCETDAERQSRVAWEAEAIMEARAELDAGRFVDGDEVVAWLKSMNTAHVLPRPTPRR